MKHHHDQETESDTDRFNKKYNPGLLAYRGMLAAGIAALGFVASETLKTVHATELKVSIIETTIAARLPAIEAEIAVEKADIQAERTWSHRHLEKTDSRLTDLELRVEGKYYGQPKQP